HRDERAVRLPRQPGYVVVLHGIGKRPPVDREVAVALERLIEALAALDRLVQEWVDVVKDQEILLVSTERRCWIVVGLGARRAARTDDQHAIEAHLHLLVRIGAALIKVGPRRGRSELVCN